MKNLVFLCSGGGGTFHFIQKAIEIGLLKEFRISGMIADRKCKASDVAKKNKIPQKTIEYSTRKNQDLKFCLKEFSPDLVITNIHKILDEEILGMFPGKFINLHYSFLPLFGGLIGTKPVEQAIMHGCRFLGTTVHMVEKEVDKGKIIGQSIIPNDRKAPFSDVVDAIFRSGCINLTNSIRLLARPDSELQPAELMGSIGNAVFSPFLIKPADLAKLTFWNQLK